MRLLIGLCFLLFLSASTNRTLSVRITNINELKGSVRIAVFSSEVDFQNNNNAIYSRVIPLSSKADISLSIPLEEGKKHGIALFHDLNDNGKLDKTMVGIPKEPYAFSNNPKAKWEKPTFPDISFLPEQASDEALVLRLLSWGER